MARARRRAVLAIGLVATRLGAGPALAAAGPAVLRTTTGESRTTVFHWTTDRRAVLDPRGYVLAMLARAGARLAAPDVGADDLVSNVAVVGPGLYAAGDPLQSMHYGQHLVMIDVLPGRTIGASPLPAGASVEEVRRVHLDLVRAPVAAILYRWDGFFVSHHALVLRAPPAELPVAEVLDLDGVTAVSRDVPARPLAEHAPPPLDRDGRLQDTVARLFADWGDQAPLMREFADERHPLRSRFADGEGRLTRLGLATAVVQEIAAAPPEVVSTLARLDRDPAAKRGLPRCLPFPEVCADELMALLATTVSPAAPEDAGGAARAARLLVALDYLPPTAADVPTADALVERMVERWRQRPLAAERAQQLFDAIGALRERLRRSNLDAWPEHLP